VTEAGITNVFVLESISRRVSCPELATQLRHLFRINIRTEADRLFEKSLPKLHKSLLAFPDAMRALSRMSGFDDSLMVSLSTRTVVRSFQRFVISGHLFHSPQQHKSRAKGESLPARGRAESDIQRRSLNSRFVRKSFKVRVETCRNDRRTGMYRPGEHPSSLTVLNLDSIPKTNTRAGHDIKAPKASRISTESGIEMKPDRR
jgi:hypothetical protein